MPGGDGTGPAGLGPMTGRAAGYCAGYPVPGFMNPVGGRGYWGWGGRGWRNWFYATGLPGWARASMGWPAWGWAAGPYPFYPAPITPEQELAGLKQQAQYFKDALEEVNKRIEELEKSEQEK